MVQRESESAQDERCEQKLKWYNTFTFLFGAIVSFADPITDVLTLVTFYQAGETTWFAVGLVFVILPCFAHVLNTLVFQYPIQAHTGVCGSTLILLILSSFHPFYPGIIRLRAFMFCFNHFRLLWRGDWPAIAANSDMCDILNALNHAGTSEAVAESAPQFILQLYAMSVQTKPVEVIQMISFPISFLSLVWTLTNYVVAMDIEPIDFLGQVRWFLWVTCLVGNRLFATAYFTVNFEWWITSVLGFHVFLMTSLSLWWGFLQLQSHTLFTRALNHIGFATRVWLVYRLCSENVERAARLFLLRYTMCMIENIAMILAYYFTLHSIAWYSLPVTITVCVLSVLTTAGAACLVIPRMCRDPRMELHRYNNPTDARKYHGQSSQNAVMLPRIQNIAETKVVCENKPEESTV